jgi:phage terminase Nu1 subunit (DNA packaging protein)
MRGAIKGLSAMDEEKGLTRQELADMLRVNPRTIVTWQELGMPCAFRGRGRRRSR